METDEWLMADQLPPMVDEPNQAEIDAAQAEEFRRGAAEQNGKK